MPEGGLSVSKLLPKSTVNFSHLVGHGPHGPISSRFQHKQYANIEIVLTEKKGYGLRAEEDLPKCVYESSCFHSSPLTHFTALL